MTYYQSLLLNLMVFKALLVVIVVVMWSIPKVLARVQGRKPREVFVVAVNAVRRQSMVMASAVARRVRGSGSKSTVVLSAESDGVPSTPKKSLVDEKGNVNWFRVFRVVSMVLFIAYPSMSVKVLRLFRCLQVCR